MRGHNVRFFPLFVLAIALLLAAAIVIGSGVLFVLFSAGVLGPPEPSPMALVSLVAISSLVIGTVLTLAFGHKAVRPVDKLSRSMSEVASGNFDVRLDGEHGIFNEINHNFNKMAEGLSSIEMLRDDFIADVSHEFKSPLSSIQGYATLLQDPGLTEEERQEYLAMIMNATRSLSNMSSNILQLSSLETQTDLLEMSRFSLDEQLRHTIAMLEPIWTERHLHFDIELSEVDIEGNEDLLETVWTNLIGNAMKFSYPGCNIGVDLKHTGDSAVIRVSDEGRGMDEAQIERIFDKFYQIDASRKTEGNGLGLALVNKIVKKHRGSIGAKSTPGKGSVFTVVLPMRQQEHVG